jgi:hypothetical protein
MKNTCKTHGIWSMVDYMKVHGGCVEYKRWKKVVIKWDIYHLLIDLLNKPKNNNHAVLKLFFKIQKAF